MAEDKKQKGFLSAIKESMDKTGGCCGGGEPCGGPASVEEPAKPRGKEKR